MANIVKKPLGIIEDGIVKVLYADTSADRVIYNEETGETVKDILDGYDEKLEKLKEEMGGMAYEGLTIKNFTCDQSYIEYGNVLTSLIFNFEFNRAPAILQLQVGNNVYTLEPNQTSHIASGLELKSSTQCVLLAYDNKDNLVSKTIDITLQRSYFYGVASNFTALSELTKTLRSSKSMDLNVTAGDNDYIYFCCPINNINDITTFSVGGFDGGFELLGLTYLNTEFSSNIFLEEAYDSAVLPLLAEHIINTDVFAGGKYATKQTYVIYKSEHSGLGNTKIKIS